MPCVGAGGEGEDIAGDCFDAAVGGERRVAIVSMSGDDGEEAYALAMALRETLGEEIGEWDARVYCACHTAEQMEQARAGRYRSLSLRNTPDEFEARHFNREKTSFIVKNDVRSVVELSLFEPDRPEEWKFPADADVVFARAYLSCRGEERAGLVRAIHARMRPGGYLFISPNESLGDCEGLFNAVYYPKAVAYRRI